MCEEKYKSEPVPDPSRDKPSAYSMFQMDNFYNALATGEVKPSGVMNYIQHLFIVERCSPNASVLDACCGRALLVPLLKKYAPHIAQYIGVDISSLNLAEAQEVIRHGDGCAPPFPCSFIQADIARIPPEFDAKFDVIAYTSALEHLDRESGIASIHEVVRKLSRNGTLYLTTPRTDGDLPRKLQYKVHVYEWDREELEEVLNESGLKILDCIGLLPPPDEILRQAIYEKFGAAGFAWFHEMRKKVPHAFLASVMASSFPDVATELLYVCQRGG